MGRYIKEIKINKLFHLENVRIGIDDKHPHLILTGRNGSGKTVTLDAVAKYLDDLLNGEGVQKARAVAKAKTPFEKKLAERNLEAWRARWAESPREVEADIDNQADIVEKYCKGEFIIAYYGAHRELIMREGKREVPLKPNMPKKTAVKKELAGEFLNFLSYQKIVASLAGNAGDKAEEKRIGIWFDEFEKLLREIYGDDNLRLAFSYQPDFKFTINTRGKTFGFNVMADGYKALLEIVTDLIMKMQQQNGGLTGAYKKEGIVMIDEIESHLHLEMQKTALPLLAKIFPNIQLIVTTHSPFVVGSLATATAFDMERRESVGDLTAYSYEALAEGYFGADGTSGYIRTMMEEMERLLRKEGLSHGEKSDLKSMMNEFNKLSEAAMPAVVGRYRQMKLENAGKIKEIEHD